MYGITARLYGKTRRFDAWKQRSAGFWVAGSVGEQGLVAKLPRSALPGPSLSAGKGSIPAARAAQGQRNQTKPKYHLHRFLYKTPKVAQTRPQATPKLTDSQPIGNPKPPKGLPKATPKPPSSHLVANR